MGWVYMKTRAHPVKKGQVIVHCNHHAQGRRVRYKYTKSNMELVVTAFREELQLLRDLVSNLSSPNPPPPVPSAPKPPPVPSAPKPPPPPPSVPKTTNANWTGRTRSPASPPKAIPEDFRQQMAIYKTYYNQYPTMLKNIPLIEFRKVDRLIPKGANLRPTVGVGNRQFENVLRNAIQQYRKRNG